MYIYLWNKLRRGIILWDLISCIWRPDPIFHVAFTLKEKKIFFFDTRQYLIEWIGSKCNASITKKVQNLNARDELSWDRFLYMCIIYHNWKPEFLRLCVSSTITMLSCASKVRSKRKGHGTWFSASLTNVYVQPCLVRKFFWF